MTGFGVPVNSTWVQHLADSSHSSQFRLVASLTLEDWSMLLAVSLTNSTRHCLLLLLLLFSCCQSDDALVAQLQAQLAEQEQLHSSAVSELQAKLAWWAWRRRRRRRRRSSSSSRQPCRVVMSLVQQQFLISSHFIQLSVCQQPSMSGTALP
jgi:hypothetical protein